MVVKKNSPLYCIYYTSQNEQPDQKKCWHPQQMQCQLPAGVLVRMNGNSQLRMTAETWACANE
jgi:hypothetical protein